MPGLRSARVAPLALAAVLLGTVVGCAPKRVVHGRAANGPATPPPAPAAGALPAPEPRGRAGATSPADPAPAPGDLGVRAASLAEAQLGKPYQWGAQGPDRFDCSGLVCHVYGALGLSVPRVSREQARLGREVGRRELRPGDLVFFATGGKGINHVGIYTGHGEFIHAPRRHVPVRRDSLHNAYWSRRFRTARRVS